MANVNEKGYVTRASQGAKGQNRSKAEKIMRDWWLVKEGTHIQLDVSLPSKYLGKRIRLKIEVVKETKK